MDDICEISHIKLLNVDYNYLLGIEQFSSDYLYKFNNEFL